MGCVASNPLNRDEDLPQFGSSGLGHHIVSLTSTTYGLLTLDPIPPKSDHSAALPPTPSPPESDHSTTLPPTPPPPPPTRFAAGSVIPSPLSEPRSHRSEPEVINSWELMAGLDADSFRFSPIPPSKLTRRFSLKDTNAGTDNKENSNPNRLNRTVAVSAERCVLKPVDRVLRRPSSVRCSIDGFEKLCPPNGENRVVVYTTSLRGVRKTFEDCSAVMAAIQGQGVWVCERDVSMDRGFREELRVLMRGMEGGCMVPPRVFVKGRYVGGAEEVLRMVEEGCFGDLLEGLPKIRAGSVCDGCGGVRFLPCFRCNGSCKMVILVREAIGLKQGRSVVVRCPDCNENGLVLCPICS